VNPTRSYWQPLIWALLLSSVVRAQVDHTPPQLVSIKITPSRADVSTQAVTFTVELAVKDDISGMSPNGRDTSYAALVIVSPSRGQQRIVFNKQLKLASGTPLDGIWSAQFKMPQASEPGLWQIQNVRLEDGANNTIHYDFHATNALDHATFEVASQPADVSPPRLVDVSFYPPSIDPGGPLRQVMVRVHATDDLSGVSFTPDGPIGPSPLVGIVVSSPSGDASSVAGPYAKWVLISGTPQDGVWQAPLDFRRLREAGAWTVKQVCLKDEVRNTRCYESELQAMGVPSLIVVASSPQR
jgi:hypothetical protein